jgi:glyoxylase-like metal-dependent hydrolase (beta-lactamase superfamily II)
MNKSLFLSAALVSPYLAACTSIAGTDAQRAPTSAPRIHEFESDANGFNTKNFFYDNGEEVIVFDTQFTGGLADQSIEFIKARTKSPITTVVVTHPNPDKFNGAAEFQKLGAKVIASEATAAAIPGVHAYKKYYFTQISKMFTDATYPNEAHVDQKFAGSFDLKLRNGEVIQLLELAQPGVSSNQTVAYIPRVKSLVVGDLVHHRVHAWLEGGIVNGKATPTISGWIADLKQLATTFPAETRVYGGRGESAPLAEAVTAQIDYLTKANQIVREHVKGKAALTDENFKALEKKFEVAFPGFGLSYMIGYGVYGLANASLNL